MLRREMPRCTAMQRCTWFVPQRRTVWRRRARNLREDSDAEAQAVEAQEERKNSDALSAV